MTAPVTQDNCTLLPCPFCGPGQSQVDLWFDDVAKRYRVGCGRCGCSTGIDPRDKTEAPAIANWNKRATPPADMEGARGDMRKLHDIIQQIVTAHDGGNLQMSSPEIGDPENDIPMHPWHEEWLHYARAALVLPAALPAPAADMEGAVRAAAQVMADLPTIDAPKLPAECWEGSARAILEGAVSALQRTDVLVALDDASTGNAALLERVSALNDENFRLNEALRLIAFSNFEPIEGTRSGTVMLTIEELRAIRELVGAAPVLAEKRTD